MQAGKVFPIVSTVNGRVVAGHTYGDQVGKVAGVINRYAGKDVVTVGEDSYEWDGKGVFTVDGEPVAVNPTYAKNKDPHGWTLAGIVALATAPKTRRRAAAPATAPAAPVVKRATTRRAPLTAKPTTAAKTTTKRAKAGATA
jgi:hypothetical protein